MWRWLGVCSGDARRIMGSSFIICEQVGVCVFTEALHVLARYLHAVVLLMRVHEGACKRCDPRGRRRCSVVQLRFYSAHNFTVSKMMFEERLGKEKQKK